MREERVRIPLLTGEYPEWEPRNRRRASTYVARIWAAPGADRDQLADEYHPRLIPQIWTIFTIP
jgi:hypothetical protein